mmetsp:Transcript_9574/g.18661  ORF Transcript_9574/g.18661 Transcript_9574/m.18661 type:complete len:236 (+) Transcript_9574:3899-4606(+)
MYSYRSKGADWGEIWEIGQHQSPIDLDNESIAKVIREDDPLHVRACVCYSKIVRQCQTEPKYFIIRGLKGSFTLSDGTVYLPVQYHFHAPSEHTVKGEPHDMELHIVHQNIEDPNKLGGLAIFFKRGGADHPFINQSIRAASEPTEIDIMSLFPTCELNDYYSYPGSLTFPSCTENVHWHVKHDPLPISDTQLKWFTSLWADDPSFAGGNGNAREVQPLNDRELLYFTRERINKP